MSPITDQMNPPPMNPKSHLVTEVASQDFVSQITRIPLEMKTPMAWWLVFGTGVSLMGVFAIAVSYLLWMGPGIWGINQPIGWGFAIANFVWFIGIGHAGTFISAVLLLLNQSWRVSVSRLAEAMTIFAILCAALFPCIHLGRPWLVYWVFPYPNSMNIYSQFKSPFVWDGFAVGTYALISLMFWYMGMVPDFAMLRDRATQPLAKTLYGIAAFGWKGRNQDWKRFRYASLILAGLATPLVISVHSIVSLDFASSILPGWGMTLFPPFFVAGAVFSGLAMVLVLAAFIRKTYDLQEIIRIDELEKLALLMLVTCWMVGYGYASEVWAAWYSEDHAEQINLLHKMFGHYGWLYWTMIFTNVLLPQLLWIKRVRTNMKSLVAIGSIVVVGMWIERFVIVSVSLERDYMKSGWGEYSPTIWDWMTLFGTIGVFMTLFSLFVRFLPVVAIHELRADQAKKAREQQ